MSWIQVRSLPGRLLAFAVIGCGAAPSNPAGDGVVLKVNEASVTLEPERIVDLAGGDSAFFHDVRSGALLSSGRIALFNAGEDEILFFSGHDGSLTGRSGTEGSGPGEFRDPLELWNPGGDTVVVHDRVQNRLTTLLPDQVSPIANEFIEPPEGVGYVIRVVGSLHNRDLVGYSRKAAGAEREGVNPTDLHVFRTRRDGSHPRTLGFLDGSEYYLLRLAEAGGQLVVAGAAPFGRSVRLQVVDSTIWTFDTLSDSVVMRHSGWLEARAVRLPFSRRRVSDRERVEYVRHWARDGYSDEVGDRREADLLTVAFPEFKPVFESAIVDRSTGRLWVAPYEDWTTSERTWRIFDLQTRLEVGQVRFPRPSEVLDLREGQVLLKTWRPDGRPRLQVLTFRVP